MLKNSSLSISPSPFLSSSWIMILTYCVLLSDNIVYVGIMLSFIMVLTSSSVLGFPSITITLISSPTSIKLLINNHTYLICCILLIIPIIYPSFFVSNTLKAASMSSDPSESAVLFFIKMTNSCTILLV